MTEEITPLQDAFENLKNAILKQWGEIPAEIENDIAAVEQLISETPVEEDAPAQDNV